MSTGRLAPSPTGHLHLGHARSFLLAWWHARSRGGRLVLRLEDLDVERVKPGMLEATLSDLEWLGLDWDGAPVVQSAHTEAFEAAVATLLARGLAYPCVCTRKEISEAQSAPHLGQEKGRYPGTCRGRYASLEEARARSGREPAVRLVVEPGPVELVDEFCGPFTADVAAEVGDFPIARRAGAPAYQLAVVVDDARGGIDEVVRGDDLLSSAARQWLLQRALGLPHPRWWHVPLVTDAAGRRLAKRSDALSLAELRARGVEARAVVSWVARQSGLAGEAREPRSACDFLAGFRIDRVPRTPVLCTPAHLAELGL